VKTQYGCISGYVTMVTAREVRGPRLDVISEGCHEQVRQLSMSRRMPGRCIPGLRRRSVVRSHLMSSANYQRGETARPG